MKLTTKSNRCLGLTVFYFSESVVDFLFCFFALEGQQKYGIYRNLCFQLLILTTRNSSIKMNSALPNSTLYTLISSSFVLLLLFFRFWHNCLSLSPSLIEIQLEVIQIIRDTRRGGGVRRNVTHSFFAFKKPVFNPKGRENVCLWAR
jgi:hypothetical protein